MGSRSRCLLVAVDNAAAVEVVRAELNRDAVAGEDTDEVFAHTSGDVCKGLVLVLKLDLEHRIRRVSTTTAITSIASSFDKRSPLERWEAISLFVSATFL